MYTKFDTVAVWQLADLLDAIARRGARPSRGGETGENEADSSGCELEEVGDDSQQQLDSVGEAASQRPTASDGGTNWSEEMTTSAAASAQCDGQAPDDDESAVQADICQAIATLQAVDEWLNAT